MDAFVPAWLYSRRSTVAPLGGASAADGAGDFFARPLSSDPPSARRLSARFFVFTLLLAAAFEVAPRRKVPADAVVVPRGLAL